MRGTDAVTYTQADLDLANIKYGRQQERSRILALITEARDDADDFRQAEIVNALNFLIAAIEQTEEEI